MSLHHTSAQDLDSTIRCAVANGSPIELATLRASRDAEAASAGARVTIIRLLDREIKRQEHAK